VWVDEKTSASTTTRKIGKVTNCPECGSANLVEDYDLGEMICHDCGLVLSEHALNRGPEWRAFTKEEKDERGRVAIPTSFSIHDKGLSTVIDRVNRDASGRQLPLATRLEMLRLRKWQIRTRVHSSAERNLAQAMVELDRLTDMLHIPASIKERAAMVYRKTLDNGLVRGRPIAAMTAASLYAACRMSETQRTLKDVSAASRIRKKDVARCYRLLVRELDLHACSGPGEVHLENRYESRNLYANSTQSNTNHQRSEEERNSHGQRSDGTCGCIALRCMRLGKRKEDTEGNR
jgi:transcription initiation factor TFIIB